MGVVKRAVKVARVGTALALTRVSYDDRQKYLAEQRLERAKLLAEVAGETGMTAAEFRARQRAELTAHILSDPASIVSYGGGLWVPSARSGMRSLHCAIAGGVVTQTRVTPRCSSSGKLLCWYGSLFLGRLHSSGRTTFPCWYAGWR